MSSYKPLADHLANRKGDVWNATFADIERTLGRPLPRSAYQYPAWWANQSGPGHSQTHGWRSVGWRTTKLDLERRRVTFEREKPAERGNSDADRKSARPRLDDELLQQAMAVSGITDPDAVVAAAVRNFIRQEAVRGLIEAGGSMPDFVAPPRERPDW
jgi:Bacterial antitoxin of type II TA system, VapB